MNNTIILFKHSKHNEDIQVVNNLSIYLISSSENSATIYTELNITNYKKNKTTRKMDAKFTDDTDFLSLDFKQNIEIKTEVNKKGCVPLIQLKHGGNPEAHLLEERSKPAPDLLGWDIPGPLAELPPPGWGDDERTSPGI